MIQTPETLLVLRDGYIDDEYYNDIYEQKRREALRAVPKQLFHSFLTNSNIIYRKVLDSTLKEE